MIARVWVPVQRKVHTGLPGGRVFGAAATIAALFALTYFELTPAHVSLGLIVPAALLTWSQRGHGFYAYGAGAGFVWLAGQVLAIGQAPSGLSFAMVILLCGVLSALWVPSFAPLESRVSEVSPGLTRPSAALWLTSVVLLLTGLQLYPANSVLLSSEGTDSVWPWLVGWGLAWAFWRQRALPVLAFAFGLGVATWLVLRSQLPFRPGVVSLGVVFALSVRFSLDRGLGTAWLLSLVPAWAWVLSSDEAGAAAVVGGTTALCVLAEAALPHPVARATGSPAADTLACLKRLAPYPRHYGSAKLRQDPLYNRLLEQDCLHGSVLDVGCGMALVGALHASTPNGRYLGLDLDPDKLRHASQLLRERGGDGAQVGASRFPDSCDDGRYDRVLLLDMLHYSTTDAQRRILVAARDHLAEGGQVVVRDPVVGEGNAHAVEKGEKWTTRFGLNPPGATHFLTRSEWTTQLAAAGLTLVSEEPCGSGNVLFVLQPAG